MESKRALRQQAEPLVAAYLENGGQIHRGRDGNVLIVCSCGYHKYVSAGFASTFGRVCARCGGQTRVEWTK